MEAGKSRILPSIFGMFELREIKSFSLERRGPRRRDDLFKSDVDRRSLSGNRARYSTNSPAVIDERIPEETSRHQRTHERMNERTGKRDLEPGIPMRSSDTTKRKNKFDGDPFRSDISIH